MRRTLFILTIAAALAGGCTVGPDYHPPKAATPPAYTEISPSLTNAPVAPETLEKWWKVFEDPELDSLIQRAIQGNRDLRQAYSRVRQARAQRGVVAAGLLPEVAATGGFDHARGSQNVILPLGGSGSSSGGGASKTSASRLGRPSRGQREVASTGANPVSVNGAPLGGPSFPLGLGGLPGAETDLYQAGLETSWEIDVFGGTRRSIEAAWANVAASEEDRRAILVSLLAEVATNYVDLRANQRRLDLARQTLRTQHETLSILQARFTNGLSTDLECAQQAAASSMTAASIPPLEAGERDAMHVLAFLIGAEPGALTEELSENRALPREPEAPPVGIPSDLLRRRPDVRRAERQLQAATAQIGAATADLFPKFSLTGVAGLDSSRVDNMFDWSSRYFGISPGVSWPVLDWGRIRSNIQVQNERQAQALAVYEDTVARALKSVEDALVHYQKEQARRAALAEAAKSDQVALDVTRARYGQGLADMLSVLAAQRSWLAAQDALAQSDGAIRSDLVKLCVALGGGWENGKN